MYSVALIILFTAFSVISAFLAWVFYESEELNKGPMFWVILCGIFLTLLGWELFEPFWQIMNREKYYANLLTVSNSIKDPYVKTEIDKVIKSINKGNKKEKIIVTMPDDFYSLARKREYDEIIKTIRSSGFKFKDGVEDCVEMVFRPDECHLTTKIEVW